ncbi:MAG: winged helix-turn-helix domain-containing protein, partial [Candidatus Eisenbacteria bacterium]|nr:winged helix-turn-helix domain-containing protein [Candidatus Eisenbacteria bacterium]
ESFGVWSQRALKGARRLGARCELHRVLRDRVLFGADDPAAKRAMCAELIEGVSTFAHEFVLAETSREEAARLLATAVASGIDPAPVRRLRRLLGFGPEEAETDCPATASAGQILEICALGPLRIHLGDRWITRDDWRSHRARRLFLALLIHRFRWVSREKLIEMLWPGVEPGRGSNNLRQTIHLLRRILEPGLARGATPSSRYILFQEDSCRLDPGPEYRYDVESFELDYRAAESEVDLDDPMRNEARWARVLGWWQGEFAADSPYDEIVAAERERLRDLYVRALVRAIETSADRADWPAVTDRARRALEEDPYHEDLHAYLIESCTRMGHRREALQAYERYEACTVRELGLPPSRRLARLAEQAARLQG